MDEGRFWRRLWRMALVHPETVIALDLGEKLATYAQKR